MIRIIVTGALGRMGTITREKIAQSKEFTLAAGIDPQGEEKNIAD